MTSQTVQGQQASPRWRRWLRPTLGRRMLLALQSHATDMDWAEPALLNASGPWADFLPRVSEVAASNAAVSMARKRPETGMRTRLSSPMPETQMARSIDVWT